jgi:hypothetical protein
MNNKEVVSLAKTVKDYIDGTVFRTSLGKLFNVLQAVDKGANIKIYSTSGKRLGKVNFFHLLTGTATGDIIHMDGHMKIWPTMPFPVEIRQSIDGKIVASYYVFLKEKNISFTKEASVKNKRLYFFQGIASSMSNIEKLTCGFFGRKK